MSQLTFAVGDLHGRYDLLCEALDWIALRTKNQPAVRIVFLGDYIDRGPDSRQIIERLMAGPTRPEDSFVCLMGNHEEMLLRAAEFGGEASCHWLHNGGEATLRSYPDGIPSDHLAWLAKLPLSFEQEHRIFVHAGLHPKRSIANQSDFHKLWIREPFLATEHDFGKHVVHGHTPRADGPELRPFRTNLDTGSYSSDRQCIAVFDDLKPGGPIRIRVVEVRATRELDRL